MFESFFKLRKHNTSIKKEFLAGFTTFITMLYVLNVVPEVLSNEHINKEVIFTSTCIASGITTLIMGLFANIPFALAPGMGLLQYFATIIALKGGFNFNTLITVVLVEGIIFLFLAFFKVRQFIIDAIPSNIKKGITVGIGMFISLIGLKNSGIIVTNQHTLASIGNLSDKKVLLAIFCVFFIAILYRLNVVGFVAIGLFTTSILGIFLGLVKLPSFTIKNFLPKSFFPIFMKFDFSQLKNPNFWMLVFTFLFVDISDTVGTLIGLSSKAGMVDQNGKIKGSTKVFIVDSIGTILGSFLGVSTITCYIESSSGIHQGGRTGLTSVFTGIFMIGSLFLYPVFSIVPSFIVAGALIFVGFLFMSVLKDIDFTNINEGLPAFIALFFMPLTYDIANGITFSIIAYLILNLFVFNKNLKISTTILAMILIFKIILQYVFK